MRGKYRGDIGIAPPGKLDPIFCFLGKGRDDIQAENARLIAAAPELLAALRIALDVLDAHDDGFSRSAAPVVRAAIAKAEGK